MARRTNMQRESDLQITSEMYLKQHTQQEICDHIADIRDYTVDRSTIARDLQAIQKRWRESQLINMNEAQQRELERIDVLEREYWQAWHDSKGQRTVETSKKAARGASNDNAVKTTEQSTRVEDLLGDPRFLSGIQWCIQMRAKILGIEAPTQSNLTIDDKTSAARDKLAHLITRRNDATGNNGDAEYTH